MEWNSLIFNTPLTHSLIFRGGYARGGYGCGGRFAAQMGSRRQGTSFANEVCNAAETHAGSQADNFQPADDNVPSSQGNAPIAMPVAVVPEESVPLALLPPDQDINQNLNDPADDNEGFENAEDRDDDFESDDDLEDNIDIEGENMAYGFENPNQAKSDSEEYFAPALSNSMHSQVWVVITQCRIFWGLLSVALGRDAGNLMRIWMQNLVMLLTLNGYPMLELSWMFTTRVFGSSHLFNLYAGF